MKCRDTMLRGHLSISARLDLPASSAIRPAALRASPHAYGRCPTTVGWTVSAKGVWCGATRRAMGMAEARAR